MDFAARVRAERATGTAAACSAADAVRAAMSYNAEISRANPAYFIILVDQSGSMGDRQAGSTSTKAQAVADAVNSTLQTIVERCSRRGKIEDYFAVSVVGYGATMGPAFGGHLANDYVAYVSQLEENPARMGAITEYVAREGGNALAVVTEAPIWFEPVANGATPMCAALNRAAEYADKFVKLRPRSFPPIVLNLTDGESTDGDPAAAAARLTRIATSDGNVLLFNLHLSSNASRPTLFPARGRDLYDEYARSLFAMSSPLTPAMIEAAKRLGIDVETGSRGFAYNADVSSLVQFLNIGTQPTPSQGFRAIVPGGSSGIERR